MQLLFAIFLILLVAIGAPAATTPSKPVGDGESKALTASQILQEFAKTQDRLMSCAYTVTMEDAFSEGPGRTRKLHYEAHVRTDATRAELRLCRWGDMTIPPNATRGKVQHAPFSREKAEYRHDLWTAQTNFTYRFWDTPYWAAHREGDPRRGVLKVKPTKDSASDPRRTLMAGQFSAAACYLFGYLRGEKDRCDVVLKRDPGLRLRERREQVNGVACWVLEARRRHGEWEKRYALWFDPEHGYNLARIHTRIDSIHSGNNAWGESDWLGLSGVAPKPKSGRSEADLRLLPHGLEQIPETLGGFGGRILAGGGPGRLGLVRLKERPKSTPGRLHHSQRSIGYRLVRIATNPPDLRQLAQRHRRFPPRARDHREAFVDEELRRLMRLLVVPVADDDVLRH